MNQVTKDLMERFNVEVEGALRIQSLMEIDFSECTEKEFDDEALRVFEKLASEEMAAPTPRIKAVRS